MAREKWIQTRRPRTNQTRRELPRTLKVVFTVKVFAGQANRHTYMVLNRNKQKVSPAFLLCRDGNTRMVKIQLFIFQEQCDLEVSSKTTCSQVVGSNPGFPLLFRKRRFMSIHNSTSINERTGFLNPSREENEDMYRRRTAGASGRGTLPCDPGSTRTARRGCVVLILSIYNRLWAMRRTLNLMVWYDIKRDRCERSACRSGLYKLPVPPCVCGVTYSEYLAGL